MLQSEQQNTKTKEDIKTAWNEGDVVGLLRAGFENFMNMIGRSSPIPFQKFLEYTGMSFDKYILDTSKQGPLNYVGGKMIMEIVPSEDPAVIPIRLSADFYFQKTSKEWVLTKKTGQVTSERFSDWNTDIKALRLQTEGKLEQSIEPPGPKGK